MSWIFAGHKGHILLHVFQLSLFEALVTLPTKKEDITCEWKIIIFYGRYIFKWLVFHCHVGFPWCNKCLCDTINTWCYLPSNNQRQRAPGNSIVSTTPQQNTHLGHLSMICQRKLSSVVELTCCTILLILDLYIQVQRCVVVFINISTGKVGMKATQRRPAPEPNLYLTKFGQLNYFEWLHRSILKHFSIYIYK